MITSPNIPFHTIKRPSLPACLSLGFILALLLNSRSHATALDFSTTTVGNWTVTGGGAVNASPYVVTGLFGRGQGLPGITITGLSLTSTSDTNGTFVSGGSF